MKKIIIKTLGFIKTAAIIYNDKINQPKEIIIFSAKK